MSDIKEIIKESLRKSNEERLIKAKEMNMSVDEYDMYLKQEEEKRQEKYKQDIINERLLDIPRIYREADINKVNSRIINFNNNKKNFCWIYGKAGTGKTYSIYALSVDKIRNGRSKLNIKKEYNIKYDDDLSKINVIDDFGLSRNDNRNKYLLDWYFTLFDYILENDKKLIITSNLSIDEWVKSMVDINEDSAMRIASRLSNVTDLIELKGDDKRKIKSQ